MFDRVLIANRGEISVRISRTLSALGIHSIAVYSDADAGARHVAAADSAVHVGPAAATESYLDVERIIDAARRSGAQALHPGYGFLSENVALAAACADAGIVFVGPPVEAIHAMGDKIRAKRTVTAHGVAVVPGIDGSGMSDAELIAAASEIGLPALIKPSAGGGGKGMRLVRSHDEWTAAVAGARREARSSFGDETLLVERYVERPRHVEVQVLADAHGHVVHLGERECSLQRRHQKVIEEAPSPYLLDSHRAGLGAQAVAAARACGYVNAGTVEFVVSGENPDEAFFLEMNTRLQVEHPVTEMVWGIDLVEMQLRIAAGETLPFTQDDLRPRGHAIEARVYAEDPANGFLPTGGSVVALREPTDRPHVRVDSALIHGGVVGSDYDPMLAKVIAWGDDRDAARRRLSAALADMSVLGLTTNISFLRELLVDPDVAAGHMDTGLIDRLVGSRPAPLQPVEAPLAAALYRLVGTEATTPWDDAHGFRIGEPALLTVRLLDGSGDLVEIAVQHVGDDRWRASFGDWSGELVVNRSGSRWELTVDGRTTTVDVASGGSEVWVGVAGGAWRYTDAPAHGSRRDATAAAGLSIVSPMPGTVVGLAVAVGDRVAAGQTVAVVEAMKMEHTLRAAQDATVREIRVGVGDKVSLHQLLVALDPLDG